MYVSKSLGALGLVAGALVSLGSICNPVSIFTCSSDADCVAQGEGGRCEPNLACSFPDAQCPSGRRWHGRADEDAGSCLAHDLADTGGSATGDTGGEDSATVASSASSTTSLGGDETEGVSAGSTGSSPEGTTSGAPDPGTSGPASTGGSAAQTCDEQYGTATDFQLCAEELDACAFNVRVDMAATCAQVCEMFGGACVTADLNDAADLCTSIGQIPCDDMSFADAICTCSRG